MRGNRSKSVFPEHFDNAVGVIAVQSGKFNPLVTHFAHPFERSVKIRFGIRPHGIELQSKLQRHAILLRAYV